MLMKLVQMMMKLVFEHLWMIAADSMMSAVAVAEVEAVEKQDNVLEFVVVVVVDSSLLPSNTENQLKAIETLLDHMKYPMIPAITNK